MITALVAVALLLTLPIAASLPFAGYGSGADAAGRGMAVLFPAMCMTVRFACFAGAIVAAAAGGLLAWSGLPAVAAGALALAVLASMGASALYAANLLCLGPGWYGRGSYAFLTVIVAPVVSAIWLLAEAYGAEPAQAWVARGLWLAAAIGPLPLAIAITRHEGATAAAERAASAAKDALAAERAAALPAGASVVEALAFHDALPEDDQRARELVMHAIFARPDLNDGRMQAIRSGDWATQIQLGMHGSRFASDPPAEYFTLVQPVIDQIIARLQAGSQSEDTMVREAEAAIGLAWPAINSGNLPRSQMQALHDAIVARSDVARMNPYIHNAKLLADLVNG